MCLSLFRNFIVALNSTSHRNGNGAGKQWMLQDGRKLLFPHFQFFASTFFLLFSGISCALQIRIFSLPLVDFISRNLHRLISPQAFSLSNFYTAFSTCLKEWKISAALRWNTTSHEVITTNWDVRKDFPAVQATSVFQHGEFSTLFSRLGARADENFPPRESSLLCCFLFAAYE